MPIVVTSDMLINQLRRDSLRIAESFDALCDADLREMSVLYGQAPAILMRAVANIGKVIRVQAWGLELLINVAGSISASALVLRAGYVLVPGVVLRNSIEMRALCIHGLLYPADLEKIRSGEFDTPRAVAAAKKVIPPFGLMYGMLSNIFTHISPLQQSIKKIAPYANRNAPGLNLNLKTLRAVIWMFYVVSEFAFVTSMGDSARYWKVVSSTIAKYEPSDDERAWMKHYPGEGGEA